MTDRPKFSRILLAAALLVPSSAAVARADEPGRAADPEPEVSDQDRLWNRMIAAELQGAIDGPLGVAGASLVVAPVTSFGLEVGGGVSRDGGRIAGGFRILLPQDHFALVMRMGIAAGPLTWDAVGQDGAENRFTARRRWEFQAGMYADVGLQYRFDMGVYLGLNGGVESSFSDRADSCTVVAPAGSALGCLASEGGRPVRIYLGLSVGYAFDIRM